MTDSLQRLSDDRFLQVLDDRIMKNIASGNYTDVELCERITLDTKYLYGINVSLHLVRKRLWNLSLRHIIFREKNCLHRYFLHPTSKQQTLKKILKEQSYELTCPLCDHFCHGSKKCKLGYDPDRINCEENTHWDFSGEG